MCSDMYCLPIDVLIHVAGFLPPNEVAATLPRVSKQFSYFRKRKINMSEAVPFHAFDNYWSNPETMDSYSRVQRETFLRRIVLSQDSLVHIYTAMFVADVPISRSVELAAVERGNLSLCRMLKFVGAQFSSTELLRMAAHHGDRSGNMRYVLQNSMMYIICPVLNPSLSSLTNHLQNTGPCACG